MNYRLFGWWYRWQACKMTAHVLAHRADLAPHPKLWSIAVFFESYMVKGSEQTLEDFGPKEPAVLHAVGDAK